MDRRMLLLLVFLMVGAGSRARAQNAAPVALTLKDAEALALKNHPQVLAAQATVRELTSWLLRRAPPTFQRSTLI